VKGEGNEQDYGMRVYDPRIGRFLSVDPLTPKYPELTPYQFGGNSPIRFVDLDGLEPVIPEEESRYERDRAELEREELHRSLGEESKESHELRDEIAREAKDNGGHWSVRTFRVLEEIFKQDSYQFKVQEEVREGKLDPRFTEFRKFMLKRFDEAEAARATAKSKMSANGTTAVPKANDSKNIPSGSTRSLSKDLMGTYERHIFSADHVKGGVMELGNNKESIMNDVQKVVNDNISKAVEGNNFIFINRNEHEVTIKFFVRNSEIMSVDFFSSAQIRDASKVNVIKQ